jgi:hypothetical protein
MIIFSAKKVKLVIQAEMAEKLAAVVLVAIVEKIWLLRNKT